MAVTTGDGFRRRMALARQPAPAGVKSPPLSLLLSELASIARVRVGQLPLTAVPPALRPQPVMLLPGFGAHPLRMRRMTRALEQAGHVVHDWGLGLNLGPTAENFAFLLARVSRIARASGRPVTLVGWSLGGLFAREVAKRQPDWLARSSQWARLFRAIGAPTMAGARISWLPGTGRRAADFHRLCSKAARAHRSAMERAGWGGRATFSLWLAWRAGPGRRTALQSPGLCGQRRGHCRSAAPARPRRLIAAVNRRLLVSSVAAPRQTAGLLNEN